MLMGTMKSADLDELNCLHQGRGSGVSFELQFALPNAGTPSCFRFQPGSPVILNQYLGLSDLDGSQSDDPGFAGLSEVCAGFIMDY